MSNNLKSLYTIKRLQLRGFYKLYIRTWHEIIYFTTVFKKLQYYVCIPAVHLPHNIIYLPLRIRRGIKNKIYIILESWKNGRYWNVLITSFEYNGEIDWEKLELYIIPASYTMGRIFCLICRVKMSFHPRFIRTIYTIYTYLVRIYNIILLW